MGELVAAQAGFRGEGDDGQLAVGVQRGADQQGRFEVCAVGELYTSSAPAAVTRTW
ncbi:hypothetical protein ACQEV4_18935 [Streptomyces shenzhenensis]|uniref:hypothetical protein n=1 Tax=Streptomyces shenzhenensis TaxID=943815 RepID=UPI0033C750F0